MNFHFRRHEAPKASLPKLCSSEQGDDPDNPRKAQAILTRVALRTHIETVPYTVSELQSRPSEVDQGQDEVEAIDHG